MSEEELEIQEPTSVEESPNTNAPSFFNELEMKSMVLINNQLHHQNQHI